MFCNVESKQQQQQQKPSYELDANNWILPCFCLSACLSALLWQKYFLSYSNNKASYQVNTHILYTCTDVERAFIHQNAENVRFIKWNIQ